MPKQKNIIVIACAASHFARESRSLTEIATTFDVSERTVRRWSEDAAWDEALNVHGYKGDRAFETKPKRDAQRDAPELFEAAQQAYKHAFLEGIPLHRLARIAVQLVKAKKVVGSDKLTSKRVREWAKAYRWAENPEETDPVKIYCAAAYYVFKSRKIQHIAETFEVAEYEVIQWIKKHPEWYEALTACRYPSRKNQKLNMENLSGVDGFNYTDIPPHQKPSRQKATASDTKMENLSGVDGFNHRVIPPPYPRNS